jgi:hypothetical protein
MVIQQHFLTKCIHQSDKIRRDDSNEVLLQGNTLILPTPSSIWLTLEDTIAIKSSSGTGHYVDSGSFRLTISVRFGDGGDGGDGRYQAG